MDLVSRYYECIETRKYNSHDFILFRYTDFLYLGEDNQGNVVIVCVSSKPNRSPLRQRTKMLSIECNMKVQYVLDGVVEKQTVHIIRCYSSSNQEKDIFIELAPLFEEASHKQDQEESLLETVAILSSFFANKAEPTDSELQGLFAELYTIKSFQDSLHLGDYWQSNDRMKFDFSISGTTKIEVKSTIKNERKHHFRHEQLAHELFDIYVVSYMLRPDDEGTSLFELIELSKPLVQNDPRRLMILERYIKNTTELRLKQCRFSEAITDSKRRIYKAKDIPRFREETPTGVSNAEYDCNLEGVTAIEEKDFVCEIRAVQKAETVSK